MPDTDRRERAVLVGIALVLVLGWAYSLLIVEMPLLMLWLVPWILLYLLWRFVRAHERIAAALEGETESRID